MYYNLSFLFANEDFITVESLHKAIIGSIALRVLSCPSVNNGFVVRLLWLLRWAQQSHYFYLISYINLSSLQSMTLRSLAKKYFSCDITLESYFISLGIKIIDIKSMKCKSNSAALCTQNSEESCFKGGGGGHNLWIVFNTRNLNLTHMTQQPILNKSWENHAFLSTFTLFGQPIWLINWFSQM